MIGRVVSTKMAKTATVLVTRTKTHPLYKKSYIFSKRYLVEDPLGVELGQVVDIRSSKPISKNKHFMITKVVGRDIEAVVTEQLKEQAEQAIGEVMPEEISEEGKVEREKSANTSEVKSKVKGNVDTSEVSEVKKKPRKRKEKSES